MRLSARALVVLVSGPHSRQYPVPLARVVVATVFALTAAIFPVLQRPALAENVIVRVDPFEGHSGATFYVSGFGLTPHAQLVLFIGCPSWDNSTGGGQQRNWNEEQGPITDGKGNFAGWPFPNFVLHGVTQSLCRVYVSYPGDFNVSDFPAYYTIVGTHVRLSARAQEIQGKVSVHPKKVRAGLVENVAISNGWGGAEAAYSVTYPHLRPITGRVRLDYNGAKNFKLKVAGGDIQPGLAHLKVHFSLGQSRGGAGATFRVFR